MMLSRREERERRGGDNRCCRKAGEGKREAVKGEHSSLKLHE